MIDEGAWQATVDGAVSAVNKFGASLVTEELAEGGE
jgi:hypothetical protein